MGQAKDAPESQPNDKISAAGMGRNEQETFFFLIGKPSHRLPAFPPQV
jgi:hypothetical protein